MPIERTEPRRVYGIYRSASVTLQPSDEPNETAPPLRSFSGGRGGGGGGGYAPLQRSHSLAQFYRNPLGVAGSTYIPFHSASACKPINYRINRYFTLVRFRSSNCNVLLFVLEWSGGKQAFILVQKI
jgi:hypothetical protein